MSNVKDYPPYLDFPKSRKQMTNADRIRAMSDEELANALYKTVIIEQFVCRVCCDDNCKAFSTKECVALIMDWLRQPAKGEQRRLI